MKKPLSKQKAQEMLINPPHNQPLTDKQKAYFEMVANALNGLPIPNYNNSSVSIPPGFVGEGYNTKGRNYSPAWGGQFQMGGELKKVYNPELGIKDKEFLDWYNKNTLEGKNNISYKQQYNNGDYDFYSYYKNGDYKNYQGGHFPDTYKKPNHQTFSNESVYSTPENPGGYWENNEIYHKDGKFTPTNFNFGGNLPSAVGNMYARTGAPSNGKYAKKTKASAQNGKEMQFFQNGLDFVPKTISQNGSIIQDDNGYYNPDNIGKPVRINSNQITMQGIPFPIRGISDTGDTKIMQPNKEYTFKGKSVTELPIGHQWDGMVEKKDGTIGMWGNPIPITEQQYSLYPKGNISDRDIEYLKSLKDDRINSALNRYNNNTYGEQDSDMFKQLLKTKPKRGKDGISIQNKGQLKKLDDLLNFTNYNTAQGGISLPDVDIYGTPIQKNPYINPLPFNPFVANNSPQFPNAGQISPEQLAGKIGKNSLNFGPASQYIDSASNVIQGLSMLKGQKQNVKQAQQNSLLTGIEAKAAATRDTPIVRKYVRPEDMAFQPNQLFPTYGTGTDILSMKEGGEIQNTFAPNTIYTDGGYEPLNDTNQIKDFQYGGNLYNSINNNEFMNNYGEDVLNSINPYIGHVRGQMPTAGNKIGGGIGEAAGTFFGGPVGGAVGKFAGNLIGGAIDQSDNKIRRYNNISNNNINNLLSSYVGQSIQQQNKAYMEDGGYLSNDWLPRTMTNFLRTGGNIRENSDMNGDLQIYDNGGQAETISENPHLPQGGETVMFRGPSHEDGGIPITYGNSPVEVEGGEPATKIGNNLVVFGNLKIPNQFLSEIGDPDAKGKKFKSYISDLSEIENKQNKLVDKSTNSLDNLEIHTPFDKLKLSSLQANIMGANMKLKDIAEKKQNAAHVQAAINDTAEEMNLSADHLAQGKIKKANRGMSIPIAQDGSSVNYNKDIPYGANISREDYNYFQNLYNQAKQQRRGPIVQKFQKEFSAKYPDIAKQVLSGFPTTNLGKSYNPDLPNTDLRGNYDSIFGPRTEKYISDSNPYGSAISPLSTPYPQHPGFSHIGTINPSSSSIIPNTDVANIPSNSNRFPWETIFNQALPYLRNSNKQNLDPNQLTGEMYALSQNQLEPVQAQTYHPELSSPYDVSYQDQLNANQGDFNSLKRILKNSPEALSQLSAQKYDANSKVLGEQFRANQAEQNRVYEGNRNTLNDAQLKNLGIYDTQYTRQSQAKSNTKAITQEALNSISSKIAQNKLENKTLQTYENLYNYRFDNQGRAVNENPLAQFNLPNAGASNINGTIMGPDGHPLYPQYKDGKFLGYAPSDRATVDETIPVPAKAKKRNGAIVQAIKNL